MVLVMDFKEDMAVVILDVEEASVADLEIMVVSHVNFAAEVVMTPRPAATGLTLPLHHQVVILDNQGKALQVNNTLGHTIHLCKTLHNVVPFKALYHTKPNYSVLKISRCACYPSYAPTVLM